MGHQQPVEPHGKRLSRDFEIASIAEDGQTGMRQGGSQLPALGQSISRPCPIDQNHMFGLIAPSFHIRVNITGNDAVHDQTSLHQYVAQAIAVDFVASQDGDKQRAAHRRRDLDGNGEMLSIGGLIRGVGLAGKLIDISSSPGADFSITS